MGGSGGGEPTSSGGSQFGGPGEVLGCGSLEFQAALMSPIPTVASTVAIGTDCEILLEGTPPQLVVYVRRSGEQLGAITERMMILMRCIGAGFAYEAEVITTAPIRLYVRPRNPSLLGLPFTAVLSDVPAGAMLTAGDDFDLRLDSGGKVVAVDIFGSDIGRIRAEPVALADAVRGGTARRATVHDPAVPTVIVTR